MAKKIISGEASRQAIARGVDALANAVKVTLGPRGRNVVIERPYNAPLVTKDGVTVAKDIELEDPIENMGAQMVKEVASKTSDVAGDGTTTATVLAQAIFREGLKTVSAGVNPMALKRGIDKVVTLICGSTAKEGAAKDGLLDTLSTAVANGSPESAQVGTISSNGDKAIGALICDAMAKVGTEGVVTIEDAKTEYTTLEVVEGMRFDRGFCSAYFITDLDRGVAVLEDPFILIVERKVTSLRDLQKTLEHVMKQGKPLVIIAEDVEGEALATLVVNKLNNRLSSVATRAPGIGDRRRALLEDIAILTGGRAITDELGFKVEAATSDVLGRAKKVIVGEHQTTIVEGAGAKEKVEARVNEIKGAIERSQNDYDKEKLKERLAKLVSGVAVIKVGAATLVEMQEKKARVEDALHATRAAIEEGIVPGGGVALLRCLPKATALVKTLVEDEAIGGNIALKALTSPLRTIIENAGLDAGGIVAELGKSTNPNEGYNAELNIIEDLVKAGIVDPTKVVRAALLNAASVAGLMLTTEALISYIREPAPKG